MLTRCQVWDGAGSWVCVIRLGFQQPLTPHLASTPGAVSQAVTLTHPLAKRLGLGLGEVFAGPLPRAALARSPL